MIKEELRQRSLSRLPNKPKMKSYDDNDANRENKIKRRKIEKKMKSKDGKGVERHVHTTSMNWILFEEHSMILNYSQEMIVMLANQIYNWIDGKCLYKNYLKIVRFDEWWSLDIFLSASIHCSFHSGEEETEKCSCHF